MPRHMMNNRACMRQGALSACHKWLWGVINTMSDMVLSFTWGMQDLQCHNEQTFLRVLCNSWPTRHFVSGRLTARETGKRYLDQMCRSGSHSAGQAGTVIYWRAAHCHSYEILRHSGCLVQLQGNDITKNLCHEQSAAIVTWGWALLIYDLLTDQM